MRSSHFSAHLLFPLCNYCTGKEWAEKRWQGCWVISSAEKALERWSHQEALFARGGSASSWAGGRSVPPCSTGLAEDPRPSALGLFFPLSQVSAASLLPAGSSLQSCPKQLTFSADSPLQLGGWIRLRSHPVSAYLVSHGGWCVFLEEQGLTSRSCSTLLPRECILSFVKTNKQKKNNRNFLLFNDYKSVKVNLFPSSDFVCCSKRLWDWGRGIFPWKFFNPFRKSGSK